MNHPVPAKHPPFADDREAGRWWLDNVYAGDDAVQLTPRAVVTGMLIGGLMSVSNLYVGLKTGWGLGVTITACIIAYAVFSALERIVPAWRNRHFTILENYTMSSAASAAGYMSSAGLVSAIPALQEQFAGFGTAMPYLDPADPASLAPIVDRIESDRTGFVAAQQQAFRIMQQYTWRDAAVRWLDVLNEAASRPRERLP